MEQQSHRESDNAEPQSHSTNYIPCAGEKRAEALEPSCSQLDTKRPEDI